MTNLPTTIAKLHFTLHNTQKWVMIYHIPRRATSAAAVNLLEFALGATSYLSGSANKQLSADLAANRRLLTG
jgi:hypothetical protein